MKLYEIDQAIANIYRQVELNGGEVGEDLEKELETLEMTLDQKVENTVRFIQAQKLFLDNIDTEIARLKGVKERVKAGIENLSAYLLAHTGNEYKLVTPIGKISWRRSSRLKMTDADSVPECYRKPNTGWKPDIATAKQDVAAGADVPPGMALSEHFNLSLR